MHLFQTRPPDDPTWFRHRRGTRHAGAGASQRVAAVVHLERAVGEGRGAQRAAPGLGPRRRQRGLRRQAGGAARRPGAGGGR